MSDDTSSGQKPSLTVDCVAFSNQGRVLLIKRKYPPFQGHYALPGGFMDIGETVEQACAREFREETGLESAKLTFLGLYSDPERDPRRHTVSAVYLTLIDENAPQAGSDAADAVWMADWQNLSLAFDHNKILSDAFVLSKELQRTTSIKI